MLKLPGSFAKRETLASQLGAGPLGFAPDTVAG
jgi:hypothetical protein